MAKSIQISKAAPYSWFRVTASKPAPAPTLGGIGSTYTVARSSTQGGTTIGANTVTFRIDATRASKNKTTTHIVEAQYPPTFIFSTSLSELQAVESEEGVYARVLAASPTPDITQATYYVRAPHQSGGLVWIEYEVPGIYVNRINGTLPAGLIVADFLPLFLAAQNTSINIEEAAPEPWFTLTDKDVQFGSGSGSSGSGSGSGSGSNSGSGSGSGYGIPIELIIQFNRVGSELDENGLPITPVEQQCVYFGNAQELPTSLSIPLRALTLQTGANDMYSLGIFYSWSYVNNNGVPVTEEEELTGLRRHFQFNDSARPTAPEDTYPTVVNLPPTRFRPLPRITVQGGTTYATQIKVYAIITKYMQPNNILAVTEEIEVCITPEPESPALEDLEFGSGSGSYGSGHMWPDMLGNIGSIYDIIQSEAMRSAGNLLRLEITAAPISLDPKVTYQLSVGRYINLVSNQQIVGNFTVEDLASFARSPIGTVGAYDLGGSWPWLNLVSKFET